MKRTAILGALAAGASPRDLVRRVQAAAVEAQRRELQAQLDANPALCSECRCAMAVHAATTDGLMMWIECPVSR